MRPLSRLRRRVYKTLSLSVPCELGIKNQLGLSFEVFDLGEIGQRRAYRTARNKKRVQNDGQVATPLVVAAGGNHRRGMKGLCPCSKCYRRRCFRYKARFGDSKAIGTKVMEDFRIDTEAENRRKAGRVALTPNRAWRRRCQREREMPPVSEETQRPVVRSEPYIPRRVVRRINQEKYHSGIYREEMVELGEPSTVAIQTPNFLSIASVPRIETVARGRAPRTRGFRGHGNGGYANIVTRTGDVREDATSATGKTVRRGGRRFVPGRGWFDEPSS